MVDKSPARRIQSYRDLVVWQRAMTLVVEIYERTSRFPADERFGLTAQLRRAAVSIAANIAEGHARGGRGDYRRFIGIARGSVAEVETELLIANRLGYGQSHDSEQLHDRLDQLGRMLTGLYLKLGARDRA